MSSDLSRLLEKQALCDVCQSIIYNGREKLNQILG